jgi:hypothetical protein
MYLQLAHPDVFEGHGEGEEASQMANGAIQPDTPNEQAA